MRWFSLAKIIYHQNGNLSISYSNSHDDLHRNRCCPDITIKVLHLMTPCLKKIGTDRLLWFCWNSYSITLDFSKIQDYLLFISKYLSYIVSFMIVNYILVWFAPGVIFSFCHFKITLAESLLKEMAVNGKFHPCMVPTSVLKGDITWTWP